MQRLFVPDYEIDALPRGQQTEKQSVTHTCTRVFHERASLILGAWRSGREHCRLSEVVSDDVAFGSGALHSRNGNTSRLCILAFLSHAAAAAAAAVAGRLARAGGPHTTIKH